MIKQATEMGGTGEERNRSHSGVQESKNGSAKARSCESSLVGRNPAIDVSSKEAEIGNDSRKNHFRSQRRRFGWTFFRRRKLLGIDRLESGRVLFLVMLGLVHCAGGERLAALAGQSSENIRQSYHAAAAAAKGEVVVREALAKMASLRQNFQDRTPESGPRQPRTREGYSILPSSCSAGGKNGQCMFVWECMKLKGQHLGMCMDGFMFGSCCVREDDEGVSTKETDKAADKIETTPATTTVTTTSTSTTQRAGWGATSPRPASTVAEKFAASGARPTRPSRPAKPVKHFVKWPGSKHTTLAPPALNPVAFARPSKPPPEAPTTTSRPPYSVVGEWTWPAKATTEAAQGYFPNLIEQHESKFPNTKKPTRPTRPSRPPRPPAAVGYFPGNAVDRPIPTATATRTTPVSTAETTTTTTSTTTTSTEKQRVTTRNPKPSKLGHAATMSAGRSGSCGLPQVKQSCSQARIVNGSRTCYGQFPWQVSVRRTSFFGFSSTHRCGGALINEYWVATAGHCVDDLTQSKIRIRIGEWDFSSTSEPLPSVERSVVKKIVHPKYNFFTYENDLALLKLDKKVTFQENIIPICLPANDDLLIGEVGTVAGWGRLSEGGKLPSVLQYVSVPIVSNKKCQSMFLKAGRREVIPDIFMCAGYDLGGRDSCQGDSGGPLVVKGRSGRWFLGGIISWGIGCAEPNLPGVCTRISVFRDWILNIVT